MRRTTERSRTRVGACWLLALLPLALSCDSGGAPPDDGAGLADLADLVGGGCGVEIAMPPDEGADHLPLCSQTHYASQPPSSGAHYPYWPLFRVYQQPVPWGFLVHGLEHGAVV